MCEHHNMQGTARQDYCPDCGYEFYYGDAHAEGDAQISKLVNHGDPNKYSKPKPPACSVCPECGNTDLFYDGNAKGCNKCHWFRVYN